VWHLRGVHSRHSLLQHRNETEPEKKNILKMTNSAKWMEISHIILKSVLYNRPFARSGHLVQNHTCWWASCTVGLPKQCHSYQSTWTCLCFGSPTAEIPYQHVIVQRAYPELLYKQFNKSPYIIISESFLFVFWSFIKSTDTELKVHELHYENALIARVGPSFQKLFQPRP